MLASAFRTTFTFSFPRHYFPSSLQVFLKRADEREIYYDDAEHERKLALRRLSRAKALQESNEDVYLNPMFAKDEKKKMAQLEEDVATYLPTGGGTLTSGQ